MKAPKKEDEYTPEEIERRTQDLVRRSLAMPHKPLKDFVGKTPRARAMAKKRKAKRLPKGK